ncbi:hypothetical protein Pyn_16584 [Prunus yedoensis var. nudiflora]|uniref:Uncharacterized protein n=1 Tax=Prunus yedoensis var. nudiflora TaxID=2094558 RepID=A0A314U652_PRUYE|nr:hypothetical protein Pyn_16584 [Prunus yedoensis var. nudiflora]
MARFDEGKRMGMHAGSNGDLRFNIPWSFGSFYLKLVPPMCWNFQQLCIVDLQTSLRGFVLQPGAGALQLFYCNCMGQVGLLSK